MMSSAHVTLVKDDGAVLYSRFPPYHPSECYPEHQFKELQSERNWGYEFVRRTLHAMGLDDENFGRRIWNPMKGIVNPGDRVLLKPNLVAHKNWGYWQGITDTDSLITHGSVIRAIADYVFIALQGCGEVIVGDSPVQGTSWEAVCRLAGLDAIASFYRDRGLKFTTRDFRLVVADVEDSEVIRRKIDQNSPDDYVEVDLGSDSMLMPVIGDSNKFAVTGYGLERMRMAHNVGRNAYLFPRIVFEANCFINLPKLKVHQKAGITCSLKNLVGINGHKDYLPHFRLGIDEYPEGNLAYRLYWGLHHLEWSQHSYCVKIFLLTLAKAVRRFFPPALAGQGQGGWHANDTLWRTVLDINRAFFYYDLNSGSFSTSPQRRYFTLIDGIVGGEKDGPLAPSPVSSRCMIAGRNPVAVDIAAAAFMGLNIGNIPQLTNAFNIQKYPLVDFSLDDIKVHLEKPGVVVDVSEVDEVRVPFEPSIGWKGVLECKNRSGLSHE